MTEGEFFHLLLGASYYSYKFGKQFVSNDLSPDFLYEVHLNCSSDGESNADFTLYPNEKGKVHHNLDEQEVVQLLVRDGKVPVWIDIAIFKDAGEHTILKLMCAGRFTQKTEYLYYSRLGAGPFGVKGPVLPNDHVEGQKFELEKA